MSDAYIKRVVSSAIVDAIRDCESSLRPQQMPLDDAINVPYPDPRPERRVNLHQTNTVLAKALERLSIRHR